MNDRKRFRLEPFFYALAARKARSVVSCLQLTMKRVAEPVVTRPRLGGETPEFLAEITLVRGISMLGGAFDLCSLQGRSFL